MTSACDVSKGVASGNVYTSAGRVQSRMRGRKGQGGRGRCPAAVSRAPAEEYGRNMGGMWEVRRGRENASPPLALSVLPPVVPLGGEAGEEEAGRNEVKKKKTGCRAAAGNVSGGWYCTIRD